MNMTQMMTMMDLDADDPNDNNPDTDGDGILDGVDADVDGDGVIDNGVDSNGDGIKDGSDIIDNSKDSDNDGLADDLDPNDNNPDTDGDGILDGADADVNGDGIVDNGTDSDGDGINDASDVDVDGDGIADNGVDSDGDGIKDENDIVDDSKDNDGDGLSDALDPNDNNPDSDGDGIRDGADVDVNGDGIWDNGTDSDGDGINDVWDIDTDGDGVLDIYDVNPKNPDSDGDGILDGADVDVNGDSIVDNGIDSDGDGIADNYDVDINGDGIADNGVDSDGDGVNDAHDRVDNLADRDGDGLADAIDPNDYSFDIDGDGIPDGADVDVNGDGVLDNGTDSDGDGINDVADSDNNPNSLDSDGDGIINEIDPDDDNDAIFDMIENERGTNPLLADSDGDGVSDREEGIEDSDEDGIIDALDSAILDSDKDGVFDQIDSDNNNPLNDSDGDGQANIKELECASDGNPLDENKRCPWAFEEPKGIAKSSVGFVYVPGGFDVDGDGIDEGGFWLSSYQARSTQEEISKAEVIESVGSYIGFVQKEFHLLNSTEAIQGYVDTNLTDTLTGNRLSFKLDDAQNSKRISSMPPYLALASLSRYEMYDSNNQLLENDFGLLTQKQYVHILMLLEADFNNGGDGKTLRNGLLGIDKNVPMVNYTKKVYEFGQNHQEYLRDLIWLIDENLSVKFSLENVKSWWKVYPEEIRYNHRDNIFGANSTVDVGFGAGMTKDNYAVVVRGGNGLNLLQGTTGVESDSASSTNGIGFRAATPYFK